MGQDLAKKHFGPDTQFKCSIGYIKRAEKRNNFKAKPQSTTRQTTIRAYLREWTPWITIARSDARTYGLITKDGVIDALRSGNLDEFALNPCERYSKRRHISPAKACMINAQSLLCTASESARICTVFIYAPMCGWKNC